MFLSFLELLLFLAAVLMCFWSGALRFSASRPHPPTSPRRHDSTISGIGSGLCEVQSDPHLRRSETCDGWYEPGIRTNKYRLMGVIFKAVYVHTCAFIVGYGISTVFFRKYFLSSTHITSFCLLSLLLQSPTSM